MNGRRYWYSYGTLLLVLLANGAEAAPPTFQSPALPHATSWVGNTYSGVPSWVQQDIRAMAVTPDGTVFTNVEWEEGGGNVGEYRDGELVRYAKHTHGWGAGGGVSVAVNSKYVFIGMEMGNEGGGLQDEHTWPAKDLKWFGVSRRWRSNIAKAAPFAGGKGGKGDTLPDSFLVVAEVPERGGTPLAGMVAHEQQLFVSDPNSSEIQVFDCETMQLTAALESGTCWPAGDRSLGQPGDAASRDDRGCRARALFRSRRGRRAAGHTAPRGCAQRNLLSRQSAVGRRHWPCSANPGVCAVPDAREMTLVETFGERGGLLAAKGVFGDRYFNDVPHSGLR